MPSQRRKVLGLGWLSNFLGFVAGKSQAPFLLVDTEGVSCRDTMIACPVPSDGGTVWEGTWREGSSTGLRSQMHRVPF